MRESLPIDLVTFAVYDPAPGAPTRAAFEGALRPLTGISDLQPPTSRRLAAGGATGEERLP